MKNTNALEELAELLHKESEPLSEEFRKMAVEKLGAECVKRFEDRKRKLDKCSRIIAELSKMFVRFAGKTCLDVQAPWCETLENCRAIAEEGAGDGGQKS